MLRRTLLASTAWVALLAEAKARGFGFGRGGGYPIPSPVTFLSVTLDNLTWTVTGSAVTIGNVVAVLSDASSPNGSVVTVSDTTNFQVTNGGVYPCAVQAKGTTADGSYPGITLHITKTGIAPFTGDPMTLVGTPASGTVA